MDTITLSGAADPVTSFDLEAHLTPLTNAIRSTITVDLRGVDSLHPSVVSVLIRHRRQARRLAGELNVLWPSDPGAARTLEHVGLLSD